MTYAGVANNFLRWYVTDAVIPMADEDIGYIKLGWLKPWHFSKIYVISP